MLQQQYTQFSIFIRAKQNVKKNEKLQNQKKRKQKTTNQNSIQKVKWYRLIEYLKLENQLWNQCVSTGKKSAIPFPLQLFYIALWSLQIPDGEKHCSFSTAFLN